MWFSVAKFKYSVFKNLLQNSNIPTCVSKCDVGCLRSVGEAVSAEWPSWKWARICIPSVLLCIFHENANLHFFLKNKRKHLFSYLARICITSFLLSTSHEHANLHIIREIFLLGFACTPNGRCYTSYYGRLSYRAHMMICLQWDWTPKTKLQIVCYGSWKVKNKILQMCQMKSF